jgi:hypothetical protein
MPSGGSFVRAQCPACGAGRFRAPAAAPERGDVLTCEGCSLKLTYGFLQARGAETPAANDEPRYKGKRKAAVRRRQRKRG